MRYQLENGFKLWTFQGAPMYETQRQNFYSFEWRPRPPLLLSTERQAWVKKHLKQKIDGYAERDRRVAKERADAKLAEQKTMLAKYLASMAERHKLFLALQKQRSAMDLEAEDEADYETVVTVTEEVVSRTEQVIE